MVYILDTVELHLCDRSQTEFECVEGSIDYNHNKTDSDDEIIVYRLFLKEEYQRKGILTKLINSILNKQEIKKFYIIEPSKILSCILLTRQYDGIFFRNLYT